MTRLRQFVVATALLGAVATLLVSILPFLGFAYRSPSAHIAIETAASLIALLAAYLVLWRYRLSASLPDLLLAVALGVLALTNAAFSTVPSVIAGSGDSFETWAPVGGRLAGALLFALAAFAPERHVASRWRAERFALGGMFSGLLSIALVTVLLGDRLPAAIEPDVSPEGSGRPRIVGNDVVLALQLVAMVLYAAAAVGFTRRATRTGDELTGWVAVAATLGAFARLNYFLFPSLYSEWVYTGDLLRMGFFLLLLVGVGREIRRYQGRIAEAAVFDERRRIARELHDGLAQELAYIFRQSRSIAAGEHRPEDLAHLETAAARALDESRDAIAALTRPLDEPLDAVLAQAAEDVGLRAGLSVRLRLAEGITAAHPVPEALARIVREAVTNAARHGEADGVEVELTDGSGIRLAIRDNGHGFVPPLPDEWGNGFGLRSMRERAEAIGGRLTIHSAPGHGTEIEVTLP